MIRNVHTQAVSHVAVDGDLALVELGRFAEGEVDVVVRRHLHDHRRRLVGRAFVRVQGMLGPEAVLTGVLGGGRDAWDRVTFVPWGEERRPGQEPDQPWPGRLPPPSPQVVPDSPWSASVLDERGRPVEVTERQELSSAPRSVVSEGGRSRTVAEWAGPWPVEERWWDVERGSGDRAPGAPRLALRMQVVLAEDPASDAGESALLLVREDARWWIRGAYR